MNEAEPEGWLLELLRVAATAPAGDSRSMAWQRLETLLRTMIRKRIFRRHRAEVESGDVTQDVIASLLRKLRDDPPEFDNDRQAMSYLRRAVAHRLADVDRRRAARPGIDVDGLIEFMGFERSPGIPVREREAEESLLGKLSREERELIELRLEKRPWQEIGERLGITPAAARMRLERLRSRLRDSLSWNEGI